MAKFAIVDKSGYILRIYDDIMDAATDRGGSNSVVELIAPHAVDDRIEFDASRATELPESE